MTTDLRARLPGASKRTFNHSQSALFREAAEAVRRAPSLAQFADLLVEAGHLPRDVADNAVLIASRWADPQTKNTQGP